jgi:hypothetical protein
MILTRLGEGICELTSCGAGGWAAGQISVFGLGLSVLMRMVFGTNGQLGEVVVKVQHW